MASGRRARNAEEATLDNIQAGPRTRARVDRGAESTRPFSDVVGSGGGGASGGSDVALDAPSVLIRRLPRPYALILMANAAYDDPARKKRSIDCLSAHESGWTNPHMLTAADHVRMEVFVHSDKQQMVLSFRGTAPEHWGALVTTLLADVAGVVGGDMRGHIANAMGLIVSKEVLDYLKKGYQLFFAGHSLGGFEAEKALDLFACADVQNTIVSTLKGKGELTDSEEACLRQGMLHASAMSFDSPGLEDEVGGRRISKGPLNIISFKGWINPVNTALLPSNPSLVYALTPQFKDEKGKVIDIFSNALGHLGLLHGLEGYIGTVDKAGSTLDPTSGCFDPVSGYPREGIWHRAAKWPQLNLEGLDTLLKPETWTHVDGGTNIPGFLNACGRYIKSKFRYTDAHKAYGVMAEMLVKTRSAELGAGAVEALLTHFVAYGYLSAEKNHAELMTRVSLAAFPPDVSWFLTKYYENKGLSEALGLAADLSLLLQQYRIEVRGEAHYCLLEGTDSTETVFSFRDQLRSLISSELVDRFQGTLALTVQRSIDAVKGTEVLKKEAKDLQESITRQEQELLKIKQDSARYKPTAEALEASRTDLKALTERLAAMESRLESEYKGISVFAHAKAMYSTAIATGNEYVGESWEGVIPPAGTLPIPLPGRPAGALPIREARAEADVPHATAIAVGESYVGRRILPAKKEGSEAASGGPSLGK